MYVYALITSLPFTSLPKTNVTDSANSVFTTLFSHFVTFAYTPKSERTYPSESNSVILYVPLAKSVSSFPSYNAEVFPAGTVIVTSFSNCVSTPFTKKVNV